MSNRLDWSDLGIHIPTRRRGAEIDCVCPMCSPYRKKKRDPCLSVNLDKETFICHHCGWSGNLGNGEEERSNQKPKPVKVPMEKIEYTKPHLPDAQSVAPESFYSWFEKERGIRRETVDEFQVVRGDHYMVSPGERRPTIQFQYFMDGELINIKYRDADKNFQMVGGARRIPYNLDACFGEDTIYFTEGEIDAMSVSQVGFKSVTSIPDGAPPPNARNYSSKFDFLDDDRIAQVFGGAKKVVLVVDDDEPGYALKEELARRIGREKCWVVSYPEGCKDANDVLVKFGDDALRTCILSAEPYPMDGLIEVSDFEDSIDELYRVGFNRGVETGWESMSPFYTVKTGYLTIVTGAPSHGKSEWLDALMVNLARLHDWRFAVYSPENYPHAYHFSKLAEKYVEKPFFKPDPFLMLTGAIPRMDEEDLESAKEWVGSHFKWIEPEEANLDNILEAASAFVLRHGIKGLVIDPWNQIEHARPPHIPTTEYISQSLSKIQRFERLYDIHVWVVAHPTKLQKLEDQTYPVASLYDVSDSAHWYNKADFGITVHRDPGDETKPVDVYITKARVKHCGRVGSVPFRYSKAIGTYSDGKPLKTVSPLIPSSGELFVPGLPVSQVNLGF